MTNLPNNMMQQAGASKSDDTVSLGNLAGETAVIVGVTAIVTFMIVYIITKLLKN